MIYIYKNSLMLKTNISIKSELKGQLCTFVIHLFACTGFQKSEKKHKKTKKKQGKRKFAERGHAREIFFAWVLPFELVHILRVRAQRYLKLFRAQPHDYVRIFRNTLIASLCNSSLAFCKILFFAPETTLNKLLPLILTRSYHAFYFITPYF